MRASEFQLKIKQQLDKYYEDVRLEWSVTTDATDLLQRDVRRYAPRVDIAIGPFNTSPGRDSDIHKELVTAKMLPAFANLPTNPNPRCLIAIEVTYSGSSKHVLGDILNASAHGLYGIVVGKPELKAQIQRNVVYLRDLATIDKIPSLFNNVLVLSTDELENMLK